MPRENKILHYLCYCVTTLGPILPDQCDLPDQSSATVSPRNYLCHRGDADQGYVN
jgi:hypothetical protein